MKKIISIIICGLAIIMLLSLLPSNVFNESTKLGSDRDYSTIVPAKPPAKPPTRL
jgi:hypothetical protein